MARERMDGIPDTIEIRLLGLEREKVRLQTLVTELLFKNQELRRNLDRVTAAPDGAMAAAREDSWR